MKIRNFSRWIEMENSSIKAPTPISKVRGGGFLPSEESRTTCDNLPNISGSFRTPISPAKPSFLRTLDTLVPPLGTLLFEAEPAARMCFEM